MVAERIGESGVPRERGGMLIAPAAGTLLLPGIDEGRAPAPAHPQLPVYASIDSAPPGFAVRRSPWVAPGFLLMFAVISVALLLGLADVRSAYTYVLRQVGGTAPREPLALGLRPFFVAFFLGFGALAAGSARRRLGFVLVLCASYIPPILLVDGMLLRLRGVAGFGPSSLVGHIIVGYMGIVVLALAVMAQCHLPADSRVEATLRRSPRYLLLFAGGALASAAFTVVVLDRASALLHDLREIALLGGIGLSIGPGAVIFQVLLTTILAMVGVISLRRKSSEVMPYSVAFLVPAFNEADGIADCIRSLDQAAANFAGPCRLYVVDNGSLDDTRAIAVAELARCRALAGEVLVCPQPGKAKALNYGLARIAEEIVIRVDADTLVSPSILPETISFFADPAVGGVGGMPAPKDPAPILARMRAIEVYDTIGFQRVYQHGVDAVTCIPGYFAAYRRQCMIDAGGFVEGINGEDTDMAVRIGRLGHRLITDPRLRMYTEVPGSWQHFREQRLRWFRAAFHVVSRNKSAIWLGHGLRGVWALPWMLVNGTRRLIMIPLVIYAGIVVFMAPAELALGSGTAFVAFIAGSQFVVTAAILAAYRRLDLMPFLPAYVVFRIIRWYLSLEMLFTLPLKDKATRATKKELGARQGDEFRQGFSADSLRGDESRHAAGNARRADRPGAALFRTRQRSDDGGDPGG